MTTTLSNPNKSHPCPYSEINASIGCNKNTFIVLLKSLQKPVAHRRDLVISQCFCLNLYWYFRANQRFSICRDFTGGWSNIFCFCHAGTDRSTTLTHLNTLRPRQNGRYFGDDKFKCIFLNENIWIPIKISLKLFPGVQLIIFQHWFR